MRLKTKTTINLSWRFIDMSNFLGVFKKYDNCVLPTIKPVFKNHFVQAEGHFYFEQEFDISTYDGCQSMVMLSGFVSNIEELCSNLNISCCCQARALAQIYDNNPKKFQQNLKGNFAISIFNKRTKELILLRDHFGSRPLYIIDHADFLAFSTDLGLLIKSNMSPLHINQRTMIDFLCLRVRNNTSTFYEEIERLEASHMLVLNRESVHISPYLYSSPAHLTSEQDPLSRFKNKFENAIRFSHYGEKNIGLMLSGGLDSSAIAIGMKNIGFQNVQTFSGNYTHLPEKQRKLVDETNFQNAVSDVTAYNHNTIPLENISPLASIDKQLHYFHEPVHIPNMYLFEEVAIAAKQKHIEVMFDGQDGDNVISHGGERFPELLKRLNLITFIYEIFCYSLFNKIKLKNTIKFFGYHILRKWGLKHAPANNSSIIQDEVFFNEAFFYQFTQTAVDDHQDKLAVPLHAFAWEWRYLFFKHFGIEVRSPFYDRDLVNFCLSLPSKWKLRHGQSRYILRCYLNEQLPSVSRRPKKANLYHGILHNILQKDIRKIKQAADDMHPILEPIIDRARLLDCIERLMDERTSSDQGLTTILAFYSVNLWLYNNKNIDLV